MAVVDGRFFLFETGKKNKQRCYLHWGEFNGHLSLNIRYWFLGNDGKEYPTRRGINIPFAAIKQFVQGVHWVIENMPIGAAPKPGEKDDATETA